MTLVEEGAREEQVPAHHARELTDLLRSASDCLGAVMPPSSAIAARIQELRTRLQQERLQIAVLGQFKRGKSSFLNALLGAPLLPTGVIPLTAIPTFIAWGSEPLVRVGYRSGREAEEFPASDPADIRSRLFSVVAEEANPRNRLGIARVELFHPAPILNGGVILIDTPGIGSTHRHNTDTALQVLSECDAALFVVSTDPPITEVELDFLEFVRTNVARIFFVLNKADYLEPDGLRASIEFLRGTLRQHLPPESDVTIFPISALDGLRAKQNSDAGALEKSGIAGIEERLLRYLTEEKLSSLRAAVSQKCAALIAEAEADLALRIRALEMPVEDLQRRRAALDEALVRIAAEARTAHDLLAGDRRRAAEQLEARAEALRQRGYRYLSDTLERALSQCIGRDVESVAQEAVAAAIPAFFEQELLGASEELGREVEDVLASHQRRLDELVNLVRRTAAELFDAPYAASVELERFKLGREPYWVAQQWGDRLIPSPSGLVERLLPKAARRARVQARLQAQARELVQRNVENLRWATLQGLDGTFRRFGSALEERLAAAVDATRGAVNAAAVKRSAAADQSRSELLRLREAAGTLAEIRARLAQPSVPHGPGRRSGGQEWS